jgi:protein ImuB
VLTTERRARLRITAVNQSAERAGLRPGMALADARAILPGLVARPADQAGDQKALIRLAAWCGRYSPWVSAGGLSDGGMAEGSESPRIETGGGAGIWLDTTGCAHLFGGEEAMLHDMTQRITGLGFSMRAVMADTPGCAWAVARYAQDGSSSIVVPAGEARAALAPLPTSALGISEAMSLDLHGLGLKRIADLLALPRAPLAARFGNRLHARLDAALGENSGGTEPIAPSLPVTPLIARLAFAEPIATPEDIAAATDRLLIDLCLLMEQLGQGARRLTLTAFRLDGTTVRLAVGMAQASRDPVHLARLFADKLTGIDPEFGLDEMSLAAPLHEDLDPSQQSLGNRQDATESLAALIDRLANRLGIQTVLRPAARESHLPERAAGLVPAINLSTEDTAPPRTNLRPIRLLRPPEPVETIAGEPNGPPHQFRWRRVLHRVVRCEGPERIAPEWWRDDKGGTRDYFRVEDSDGRRFWLYREDPRQDHGEAEREWFLHGLFG